MQNFILLVVFRVVFQSLKKKVQNKKCKNVGSKKSNEQLHLIYIFGWLAHFITYERKYINFFKFIYYFRFIFRLFLLCIVFGIISYLWYVIIGVMIIHFNSIYNTQFKFNGFMFG